LGGRARVKAKVIPFKNCVKLSKRKKSLSVHVRGGGRKEWKGCRLPKKNFKPELIRLTHVKIS